MAMPARSAADAVQAWYDECKDPGYDFQSCEFNAGTGHFTQVCCNTLSANLRKVEQYLTNTNATNLHQVKQYLLQQCCSDIPQYLTTL